MIITCEACGTSFKIKTSLINETGSTVRCSKCQQVFIAYPNPSENEKSTDLALDKSLEEKIEDVLGDEFDDEFSDLESEISLETAEISMATSEELFDTGVRNLDLEGVSSAEPEVMMSELEQDDDDILSLDDLESGATSGEALDLGAFLADDEDDDDSDVLNFGDLGAMSTVEDDSEILSFDDIDQENGEVTLDDLESTSDLDDSEIELDELDSGELGQEDLIAGETIEEDDAEDDEEEIDFLDFEDDEVQQEDEIELKIEEELIEDVEPEEVVFEMEGGVDTDLDDLEKKSEDGDTSKGFTEDAGKVEKPAEETSKIEDEEDEFDLDFDLDDEAEAAEEISVEDDDLGLDLDGFEDLDLTEEPLAEASVEDDDLELDLDMDLDGFEDLDLTEESSVEASVEEDLGIELEAETETDDLGLDLDLDEFDDLDLDLGVEEESSAVASAPEVEEDDFDLDFDLDSEEVAEDTAGATAEEEDFDLDFDLDAEEETGAEEETFELDLNIEPEPVGAEDDSDEFDLDLDLDDDIDASSVVAESFVDDGEEDTVTKTEEFDLTQIEDVLDFDELPEPGEVEVGASENLDGLEMELEESEPNTVADDDEMSIDLETMLDDEDETLGDEKEVSLETVEEREQKIEQEYKKTVIEEREMSEEFIAEVPGAVEEEFEETLSAQMPVGGVKGERSLKKILIPLILLIVVGVIAFVGIKMFGGKEEMPVKPPVAPVVKDQGNLQIEMIANPEYKFVENEISGEILVVTGNVTNRYDHPRSNVHVKGTLYNSTGEVIVTSSAYCGNMLTDSDLTTLELKTINERLNNRMGDDNLNTGIETGKNIPFTVVFSGLSEDISELTVEVLESAK